MDSPALPIAVAIVRRGREVLIGRRPSGVPLAGFWEFPGGKVRSGETDEAAAARECLEETGLRVRVVECLQVVDFRYDHGPVRLHFFEAEPLDPGAPVRAPFRWVRVDELARYSFPPANHDILEALAARNRTRETYP